MDSQSELLLVEFLLTPRVLLPSSLEELIILLVCRLRVHRLELKAVLHVGDNRWGKRVKVLIEMTRFQLRELFLRGVSGLQPGVLFLHPLNLAHCKFPPLL